MSDHVFLVQVFPHQVCCTGKDRRREEGRRRRSGRREDEGREKKKEINQMVHEKFTYGRSEPFSKGRNVLKETIDCEKCRRIFEIARLTPL